MESYYIVKGRTARREGLYKWKLFVLDDKEEAYDDGIWFIPNAWGIAQWFRDWDELLNSNIIDNHPL
jgi:hypothetical protein